MDPLDTWRDTIERILSDHAAIPYANSKAKSEVVFDRHRDHYLIVDTGWDNGNRVHATLVHIDIHDGRIWIEYDGTERGIAAELVEAGVARESIVLGFREPELRKYTGYAAA